MNDPLNRSRPLDDLVFAHSHPDWEDNPLQDARFGTRFILNREARDLNGNPYLEGTPVVFCFWPLFNMYEPPEESLALLYLDPGPLRDAWQQVKSAVTGKECRSVWFQVPATFVSLP